MRDLKVTAVCRQAKALAVQRWHFNDKGEKVVDERVERLVHHGSPRQVGDGLQLVVDEQLRRHQYEAKGVDEPRQRANHPGPPTLVLQVAERVRRVAQHERHDDEQQVTRRDVVEPVCVCVCWGKCPYS